MKAYFTFSLKSKIVIVLFYFFITSCKTTEYVTIKEKEYITDSIAYEKTVTDTVFREREVREIQEIEGNTFLPCPKDSTETGGFGALKSGKNYYKWRFNNKLNGYDIEFFLAKSREVKDSIHEKREEKEKDVQYVEVIKEVEVEKQIHTEKITLNFWQKLWGNIYKFLFIIVLILWLFGITPKFILKKIF